MHLDYIEDMYLKHKLNKLTDSDIKDYHNKFTNPSLYYTGGRRDRLKHADFTFNSKGLYNKYNIREHITKVL